MPLYFDFKVRIVDSVLAKDDKTNYKADTLHIKRDLFLDMIKIVD